MNQQIICITQTIIDYQKRLIDCNLFHIYGCTCSISCFGSCVLVSNLFSHRSFFHPGTWSVVSAKLWTSSIVKYVFHLLAQTCNVTACLQFQSHNTNYRQPTNFLFCINQVPRAIVNLVELLNIIPLRDLHRDNTLGCPTWFVRSVMFGSARQTV